MPLWHPGANVIALPMVSVPCQSVIGICHLVIMSKRYLDWLPSVTVLGEVYGMKENVPGGLVPLFQQVGSLFQQLGGPCSDRCSKFLTIIAHRGEGEGEGGRGVIQAAHSAYSSLQSSFLCPPSSSSSFTCYNACLPPRRVHLDRSLAQVLKLFL